MNMVLFTLGPIALGFLLDLLVGDPQWMYHPVRAIGKLIEALEKLLRKSFPATPKGELAAGRVLSVAVPLVVMLTAQGMLILAARIHAYAWFALETIFCYQILAARDLWDESMAVYDALKRDGLSAARARLSRIVGRDTKALDEAGVLKATVETVAENTADGVVAPLLYMMMGGAALGYCYKAVNTLDSMVGYKDDRYLHFGRASAKLDDVANYLPSRFAALCILTVGKRYRKRGAYRVWIRDRRNHQSPNSAQTEAAVAGVLGIRLGGDAVYFGKAVKKPVIGDDTRPVEREDIRRANILMVSASCLSLIILGVLRAAMILLVTT